MVSIFSATARRHSMVSDETSKKITGSIRDSLEKTKKDIPQLAGVVDAFEDLLVKRTIAKFALPTPNFSNVTIDFARFSQGVPVLDDGKIDIEKDSFKKVALLLLPAMRKGFPKLDAPLSRFESFINESETAIDQLLPAIESTDSTVLDELARNLDISPTALQFVCSELAKPFTEKIAEAIAPLIQDVTWLKGYCPVCGAWPELSSWKGPEGRRFLNCSVCGHEWTYMRTQCPFCENSDNAKLEIIFSEDRKFEHAELCHECMKYIVGLDTRNMVNPPHPSAASLGLIYLDFLAQERGFAPGATSAWNVLEKI